MKPRIYVDFDDVICETALPMIQSINQKFNKKFQYSHNFSFNLQESFGLTKREYDELMILSHTDEFLSKLRPTIGVRPALELLSEIGYDIHIITGRPSYTNNCSVQWLRTFLIPHSALLFVNKYHRRSNDVDSIKTLPLCELPLDEYPIVIEDSPHIADFVLQHTRSILLLFDRPWNHAYCTAPDYENRFFRVKGWMNIIAQVALFEKVLC